MAAHSDVRLLQFRSTRRLQLHDGYLKTQGSAHTFRNSATSCLSLLVAVASAQGCGSSPFSLRNQRDWLSHQHIPSHMHVACPPESDWIIRPLYYGLQGHLSVFSHHWSARLVLHGVGAVFLSLTASIRRQVLTPTSWYPKQA